MTAAQIRAMIAGRRRREKIFERVLFADPAWDMLLDLAAARLEERRVSISSLCLATPVAQSTGLRWIDRLERAGLVVRTPDPADNRRCWISISDVGAEKVAACLETPADPRATVDPGDIRHLIDLLTVRLEQMNNPLSVPQRREPEPEPETVAAAREAMG